MILFADQLKNLIIDHYRHLDDGTICERVKMEVIPSLISEFFQNNLQLRRDRVN